MTTEEFYEIFGEWTYKAFPDATSKDHLKKLIHEAIEAIDDPGDLHEYADCLMALFGAAYKAGFGYPLLLKAAIKKLEVNRHREWVKLSDGTYQHK